MATPVTLGTAKTDWIVPIDSGHAILTTEEALESVGTHAGFLSAPPGSDPPNGRFVLSLPTDAGDDQVTSTVALGFYGTGGGGTKLLARVWGLSNTHDDVESEGVWGVYIGEFEILLGTKTYNGSTGAAPFDESGKTYRFADTILVTGDYSNTPPGFRVVGAATGAFAVVFFDSIGFRTIVVSLAVVNADSGGLAWRSF